MMNADGSGKTDLTADDATNDRQPVFSPDGTSIAFMSDHGGSQRIWTMGCTLGKVSCRATKGRAGVVVAQAKKAGRRLPLGTKVAVTLSR